MRSSLTLSLLPLHSRWLVAKPFGERIFQESQIADGEELTRCCCDHCVQFIGRRGRLFLKLASGNENSLKTTSFYIGFVLYASTAFGWVFVMKHLKLATIGVVYSISMVLLLTAIGVVFFRESLNHFEIAGLVMAIVSLILLIRFA
jgi:small multidrug resistance pump